MPPFDVAAVLAFRRIFWGKLYPSKRAFFAGHFANELDYPVHPTRNVNTVANFGRHGPAGAANSSSGRTLGKKRVADGQLDVLLAFKRRMVIGKPQLGSGFQVGRICRTRANFLT